jgi:hypothetical protein
MINRARWWLLLLTVVIVIGAWPPAEGPSLMMRTVNWGVDPSGSLPTLPPQLGFGLSDDPQAVEIRDELVRRYDQALARGGWTRLRLRLKVASDPFEPVLVRQLLLMFGAAVGLLALRPGQVR